eukprot:2976204-Prymnesium_polylepis.1
MEGQIKTRSKPSDDHADRRGRQPVVLSSLHRTAQHDETRTRVRPQDVTQRREGHAVRAVEDHSTTSDAQHNLA